MGTPQRNWTSKDWSEWLNTLAETKEQTGTIDPHPDALKRCASHIEQLQSDLDG